MGETLQYSIVVSHIAHAMKHYIFKGALGYLKLNRKEQSNPGATPGLFFSRTRHYQSYFNVPYKYGRKEFHYVFCRW